MKYILILLSSVICLTSFSQKSFMFNVDNYPEYYEYRDSPCFNEIGWNPFEDKEYWDKRYEECEERKRSENLKRFGSIVLRIGFIVFVLGGIGALFYFGYYKKKKM